MKLWFAWVKGATGVYPAIYHQNPNDWKEPKLAFVVEVPKTLPVGLVTLEELKALYPAPVSDG